MAGKANRPCSTYNKLNDCTGKRAIYCLRDVPELLLAQENISPQQRKSLTAVELKQTPTGRGSRRSY